MQQANDRDKLNAMLASLGQALAGRLNDAVSRRLHDDALRNVGLEALAVVKQAFVVKARGGTDDAGQSWPPLKPETVAYGRRHPGKRKSKKPGSRPSLTPTQNAAWRKAFAQVKAARMAAGDGEDAASAVAAGHAWNVVKGMGARTVLEKYGGAKVEINRDTGRLLASLSPGKPGCLIEVGQRSVSVGTSVPYAPFVHARRPLWLPVDRWPKAWTDRLAETLKRVLAEHLRREVR